MFIFYEEKPSGTYGKIIVAKRVNGEKVNETTNLGRVLDKERGIFKNRERGVFTYSIEKGYGKAPVDFVPQIKRKNRGRERLIVDFGDTFFIKQFLVCSGLKEAVDAIGYGNPDTLYTMLSYYITSSMANCHAKDWYEGNYARIAYPNADISSQRISDFLTSLGDEYSFRAFFAVYMKYLKEDEHIRLDTGSGILIDSTGLPNSIHFPLTAISNHNGEISNEVRLIYVVHQKTGMPIYFRYCPGNVIDTSTLIRTVAELKQQGVNTKFAILDAGYYSDENIQNLYDNNISFITRLKANRSIYKDLVAKYLPTIEKKENFVSYNTRYAYIQCVPCSLIKGHSAYAYVGLDISRKSFESQKIFKKAQAKKLSESQVFDTIQGQGAFILVSSRRIAKDNILPLYYSRQQIEQIFDIGKNYAEMLPLRVQSEETFRGHLLLTFMTTVFYKLVQDRLKPTELTPESMFLNLRNHKCKVYDRAVIPQEVFKKANDSYKIFKIRCPVEIER